ncbi:MAG: NmrA family NAD(P)-binding protein [Anaerolineaceae bacterium]|nr:NmrA family NAD(P)-binding protein [Anaerolineaceae bacterium]
MILVTGGTGFIGRVLIRHLASAGHPIRTLVRPSRRSPNLPSGVSVEVAVCSLKDERGLRAAMKGVQVVYHLAGAESQGSRADLLSVDIQGTQAMVRAAADAHVQRLFYLSHLGADRASAFPVLKAKAIAENFLRQSGIDTTILRSAVVFGQGDHFTTALAKTLHALPGLFLMPGDGLNMVQPLWVEDLATCLTWAVEDEATRNRTYSVGGSEYLTLRQVVETIEQVSGLQRNIIPFSPAYLRGLTVLLEHLVNHFPLSVFWLDYFAANRTCPMDTLPRVFGLIPAKFSQRLDYLHVREPAVRTIPSSHRNLH